MNTEPQLLTAYAESLWDVAAIAAAETEDEERATRPTPDEYADIEHELWREWQQDRADQLSIGYPY